VSAIRSVLMMIVMTTAREDILAFASKADSGEGPCNKYRQLCAMTIEELRVAAKQNILAALFRHAGESAPSKELRGGTMANPCCMDHAGVGRRSA